MKEVLQPGANDVYIVEDEAKKEILLPAIPDVIKKIDIANNKMIVKLLKGLIWKNNSHLALLHCILI